MNVRMCARVWASRRPFEPAEARTIHRAVHDFNHRNLEACCQLDGRIERLEVSSRP
jgi:hypothetical protein